MTLKVFISPQFNTPDTGEGGIRRVIEAQIKHLPKFGVEVTGRLDEADLTIGHAGNIVRRNGKPYIACVHGLMWKDYFVEKWAHEINGGVVASMLQADAITVPSQWVRQALTRGIMRRPKVIYHGVDFDQWHHKKQSKGYILWNKGRADKVSEPDDMQRVASMMVDQQFVSTFGTDTDNVNIIGRIPAPKMKDYIQRAGVYLALPRETFGIGILEAMASGVPIAGWRYGGQQEIVIEGETGYLADPGNYDQLRDCIYKCIAERERLSRNCQEDVRTRWGWEDKIEQYADLFKLVCRNESKESPRVSVIVTCHNLGRYLPDALSSLLNQTYKNWECIIVDDQSTDNTAEIAMSFWQKDKRFRYFRTPENLKLCGALNYGFEQSAGKYVINLDADNMLPADALRIQVEALDADPGIHIVSGDLDLISDDGTQRRDKIWHNKSDFDFRAQFAHINNIHSSSMMRRSVREELGGYRERYWRAEDAHFWCMAVSYGFWIKMCTGESTLIYRQRSDSKSMHERNTNEDSGPPDGDWTIDFPWRIAGNPADGARLLRDSKGLPNAGIVPIGAQFQPTVNHGFCWNIYHRQNPLVSVIIPVGPGHKKHVIDALDSLMAQDFHDWEAVVINDTGDEWNEIPGAPYANVFKNDTGRHGPAVARNVGHTKARGKFILYLDADDYLMPGSTLRKMIARYAKGDAGYIYGDYVAVSADNKRGKRMMLAEFNQGEWKEQSPVTVLIAKEDIMRFGGFDEYIRDWEEWDLFLKMQVGGVCGVYLPIPTFFYRYNTGRQRESSAKAGKQEVYPFLRQRYKDYFDGVKQMGQCCGGNGDAVLEAKAAIERSYQISEGMTGVSRTEQQERVQQQSGIAPQWVRMEYVGPHTGAVTYFGRESRQYRGGRNPNDQFEDVHPADVQKLEVTGHWKVIHVQAEKVEEIVIEPESIEIQEIEIPLQMTESIETVRDTVELSLDPATVFDPVVTGLMKEKKKTKARQFKNGRKRKR